MILSGALQGEMLEISWNPTKISSLKGNNLGRSVQCIIDSKTQLCAMYDPKPKTVNAQMYSDMIREQVGPAVLEVYPDGSGIFQDDGATIHRARISLDAVEKSFNHHLSVGDQASKQLDMCPIKKCLGNRQSQNRQD